MTQNGTQGGLVSGQVAIVTGSTQGIGAGIARKFAAEGAAIVIHGLEKQRAQGEQVAAALRDLGAEALVVFGDLKDEAHCRDLIRQTLAHFGRLDILVNNAGVVHRGTIESTPVALWDEIFAVNLRAPFILCQEAVKHMKERRSGCIINIGSLNAYIGLPKVLGYSVSKGALMTFTKNLAHSLTKYRIRANQINAGWTLTEGEHYVQSVVEGKGEKWLEDVKPTLPYGRLLLPADIAGAALFLASSELITGTVLDYNQDTIGALPD